MMIQEFNLIQQTAFTSLLRSFGFVCDRVPRAEAQGYRDAAAPQPIADSFASINMVSTMDGIDSRWSIGRTAAR